MNYQHTLKRAVRMAGIGLHSGKRVEMTILPAPEHVGICFKRVDLEPQVLIPANYQNVVSTTLCTTLGIRAHDGLVTVSTVEHLMAAFFGLGIDNAMVELDGVEVPSMDGSAAPFYTAMKRAGKMRQKALRKAIKVKRPVSIEEEGKAISIEPSDGLTVDFEIDFDHPMVERQKCVTDILEATFERHIAKARTFGFLHEVEYLRQNGYALGGSLENAVVVGDQGILNGDGLRFPDEFVRHKILDLLGDFYLLGCPVIGRITSKKSGHTLHNAILRKLMDQRDAWEFIEGEPTWQVHRFFPSPIPKKTGTISGTTISPTAWN